MNKQAGKISTDAHGSPCIVDGVQVGKLSTNIHRCSSRPITTSPVPTTPLIRVVLPVMSAVTSIELFSTNIPISELPTPTLPNSPGPSDFVISNCSPFGSWSLRPADVAPPYCAYNHNETIPNLSSCCKEGAEVYVYGDCVQYVVSILFISCPTLLLFPLSTALLFFL